jgi:hypothetical protein
MDNFNASFLIYCGSVCIFLKSDGFIASLKFQLIVATVPF